MYVMGIHGGQLYEDQNDPLGHLFHDSAAVLLRDGEVVAAIEEERLDRIKHSNCFPFRAVARCLELAGIGLGEVDRIAVNISKYVADAIEKTAALKDSQYEYEPNGEARLASLFEESFGIDVRGRIYFCNHHVAHAWSTFVPSEYDESLILTIDGDGDNSSGMVFIGKESQISKVREYSVRQSLGRLYHTLIAFLGYSRFDEFKVMGLAPYGDPEVFRELFSSCYRLHANGDYMLEEAPSWFARFDDAGIMRHARRKSQPFSQLHKDFAAALQETTEKIVLHVLSHYARVTGQRYLCLAGGVVHNCSMNGKIISSGIFDGVYAQPAAHDAGGALGAAWWTYYNGQEVQRRPTLPHLYLGSSIGEDCDIEAGLRSWREQITFHKSPDIAIDAARLLADGYVVGWVQGRSEFGPRALGNRSIVADPRPAENKLLINSMVKKREQFRPFAPSVLEEHAAEYFKLPSQDTSFPYMIFVLEVLEPMRTLLGAITHIDGTARVQTVSMSTNPLYWRLIFEFAQLTGLPMLLNTSFNNNAEPIVDSLDDSVACFVTTGLHYLAIGNYLVEKAPVMTDAALLNLVPTLPVHYRLARRARRSASIASKDVYEIDSLKSRDLGGYTQEISEHLFHLLCGLGEGRSIIDLLNATGANSVKEQADVVQELKQLWVKRMIRLLPRSSSAHSSPTAIPHRASV